MKLDNRQSLWPKRLDRYIGIPLVILAAIARRVLFLKFWAKRDQARPKILVIKLSALGDAVLMLPALYHLRQCYPAAEIIFLGGSSNVDFAKLCPGIDRVETFSPKTCVSVLGQSYELVIDFDQWVRATALLSALCASHQICGFMSSHNFRHFAYDKVVAFERGQHMARNFWNLAKRAAAQNRVSPLTPQNDDLTFDTDKENVRKNWVPELLRSLQSGISRDGAIAYTIIHPGCGEKNGQPREWPLDSWKIFIRSLRHKTSEPVYVTGKGEREKEWGEALKSEAGVASLVNQLNLQDLIVTLSKARRVVASNTGIMHLADLVNDSVFVLEGPTDSTLWGPLWRGQNIESPIACSPCLTWGSDYGCSDPVCMKAIRPKQLLDAQLLEAQK